MKTNIWVISIRDFQLQLKRELGAHVWDTEGKEYIDCMGGYGVALVGHQNQRVNNAIKKQIDKIITVHSSLYNKTREEFLKKLIEIAPEGLTQVHLNNSGCRSYRSCNEICKKVYRKERNGCNERILPWKIIWSIIINI